jgi:hypothetical protein
MVEKGIAVVLQRMLGISMLPDRHGSGATRIEADPVIKRGECYLMRRASTCLAIVGLAVLGLPAFASAIPVVTLKAKAVPIPGFPHTGNIYGAGAAVQAEYTISGTEYAGFPPPLIKVNFYLPKGSKLHPKGFATCAPEVIEKHIGTEECPKGSKAGPVGKATGVVRFGKGEPTKEETTIEPFFAPNGGLEFWTEGKTPVELHFLSKGKYLPSSGLFSQKLEAEVPLVETVTNAPDASVETISVKVGAAIKEHGKTIYYGTLPKKGQCPKKGFPIKSELFFAGLGGLSPQEVTAEYRAPCPRH